MDDKLLCPKGGTIGIRASEEDHLRGCCSQSVAARCQMMHQQRPNGTDLEHTGIRPLKEDHALKFLFDSLTIVMYHLSGNHSTQMI